MNIEDVKIIADHTHNDDKRMLAEFAIQCFERAEKAEIFASFGVAHAESPFKFAVLRDALNSIPSFMS